MRLVVSDNHNKGYQKIIISRKVTGFSICSYVLEKYIFSQIFVAILLITNNNENNALLFLIFKYNVERRRYGAGINGPAELFRISAVDLPLPYNNDIIIIYNNVYIVQVVLGIYRVSTCITESVKQTSVNNIFIFT